MSVAAFALLALAALAFALGRRRAPARHPLPPGPRRLPLLDNLFNFPGMSDAPAIARLGALAYTHVLGTDVLYLNTAAPARDLLERRARIYSDRPHLVYGGDLCGQNSLLTMMRYDKGYRRARTWLQSVLGAHAVPQWAPAMAAGAAQLSARLTAAPAHYDTHIRQYSTALILQILYGYTLAGPKDPFVRLAADATAASVAAITETRLVNAFPLLRHIPAWMPGAGFQRAAARTRALIASFAATPFAHARAHPDTPSLTASLRDEFCRNPEDDDLVMWSISAVYGGGADTTASLLASFLLAMTRHPDAQARAHAELAAVVALGEPPGLEHRALLPYVDAIVKEVLRWGCPANFAVPHRLTEEDEYMGYRIPRGTICVANVWAMLHDPDTYAHPLRFTPERFLRADPDPEPELVAFGFGGRRCPGINFARQANWLAVATLLATTTITAAGEEDMDAANLWHEGAIRHPVPFACDVRPRQA